MSEPVAGGCQCGQVRYEVRGKLRDVIACHCVQCRRTSGTVKTTNRRKSSVRAKVEHVFGVIKRVFGFQREVLAGLGQEPAPTGGQRSAG